MTKLIVKYYHEISNHNGGMNQTVYALSAKYWITAAHQARPEWKKERAACIRRKTKRASKS